MTFAELRRSRGFSQVQLAKELGVDQSTVSLWESGKTAPRMEIAFQLPIVLGCTLDEALNAIRESSNTNTAQEVKA